MLKKFQEKYPEWFLEKKVADGIPVTDEELRELKPMPFMAMVASVGSNDQSEMYNYLGGTKNNKRSEELDAAFKQDKSNFHIVIVVDMWITGFDVPSLTYMYNDKPLKKHLLIQTISRVNRKYPGKEYGLIVDYIGIRDNMREAMKLMAEILLLPLLLFTVLKKAFNLIIFKCIFNHFSYMTIHSICINLACSTHFANKACDCHKALC